VRPAARRILRRQAKPLINSTPLGAIPRQRYRLFFVVGRLGYGRATGGIVTVAAPHQRRNTVRALATLLRCPCVARAGLASKTYLLHPLPRLHALRRSKRWNSARICLCCPDDVFTSTVISFRWVFFYRLPHFTIPYSYKFNIATYTLLIFIP